MNKKKLFNIIQIGSKNDIPSFAFDIVIVVVIVLNLFVTFFSTFEQALGHEKLLDTIELVTVIIFAVEYILRLWTSEYLYPDKSKGRAALSFAFSASGLVDLLSFLPYFLPVFFPAGAVAFRIFRVIRIFKLFRINAQYDAFNVIIDVVSEKKDQLISSMCIIIIFMMATSMCMYSVEHEAQPELFKNAFSGLWWSASTLLTIGYGDVYPITTVGKILAILISFLGVGLVAIPTGIISAAFVDRYSHLKDGGNIDDKAINFVTPTLKEGHPWIGMKVGEVILPPQMEIINIFRNEKAIDPKDNSRLKEGDELVIYLRR
ncbi:MAG: ion transporter [Lachnospiraceae bacterium]|nr:ion transporter [Lachnospiraceae bacterium]